MYTENQFTCLLVAILLLRPSAIDAERQIATAIAIAEMIQSSVVARARRNEKLPPPAAEVPTDE